MRAMAHAGVSRILAVPTLAWLAQAFLVTPAGAAVNDDFASRIELTGSPLTVQGHNVGASIEPGEDTGREGGPVGSTVWYGWTAPTSGVLYVSGNSGLPSFALSVSTFRGDALTTLVRAAATPDGGFPLVAGETLMIQVGSIFFPLCGCGGPQGGFTLELRFETPTPTSTNDLFGARALLSAAFQHFVGSIYGATNEPAEPLPAPGYASTLWWSFQAPENGLLRVTLSAGQFPSRFTVYEGSTLESLVAVPAVNGIHYPVQKGREYSLQLAAAEVASGNFWMDTRFFTAANDGFCPSSRPAALHRGRDHFAGTRTRRQRFVVCRR